MSDQNKKHGNQKTSDCDHNQSRNKGNLTENNSEQQNQQRKQAKQVDNFDFSDEFDSEGEM